MKGVSKGMWSFDDPDHDFTDRDFYDAVWTLLVEHADACKDPRERESFIRSYCEVTHPTTEYRFQGCLGFGGKFWRGYDGFRVSCYREDETPKTLAVIKKVNALLLPLVSRYAPKSTPGRD